MLNPEPGVRLDLTILRSAPELKPRVGHLTDYASQGTPRAFFLNITSCVKLPSLLYLAVLDWFHTDKNPLSKVEMDSVGR